MSKDTVDYYKSAAIANELIEIIAGHHISLEMGVDVIAKLIEFFSAYHSIPEGNIVNMINKQLGAISWEKTCGELTVDGGIDNE